MFDSLFLCILDVAHDRILSVRASSNHYFTNCYDAINLHNLLIYNYWRYFYSQNQLYSIGSTHMSNPKQKPLPTWLFLSSSHIYTLNLLKVWNNWSYIACVSSHETPVCMVAILAHSSHELTWNIDKSLSFTSFSWSFQTRNSLSWLNFRACKIEFQSIFLSVSLHRIIIGKGGSWTLKITTNTSHTIFHALQTSMFAMLVFLLLLSLDQDFDSST